MASFPTPQNIIYHTFKGIRTRNGVVSNGQMSATECQNIDFIPNTVNGDIQIRTTLGNSLVDEYENYKIIKGFSSEQEGTDHMLLYVEDELKGRLVEYNTITKEFVTLIDNLTVTGQANGITMVSTAYDVFVFTNGVDYYSVQLYPSTVTTKLEPKYDYDGDGVLEDVTGLAICEQSGSLVIGSDKGYVIASRKGDIEDWDYAVSSDDENKPWYQIFGKSVTAVVTYIDSLLVFTEEDSTALIGNPSIATGFERTSASLGGCMSFESWVKHDKYLFFYDNRQKNIYYYMQNNFGQKILGQPLAPEVQLFFDNVTKLQMVSYIGENKNEIWILANDFILIYDYFVSEWTERKCQPISSYFVYDNKIFSTTEEGKLLREKVGDFCVFDGKYYNSKYTTQVINLGSYSNLKEMEIQPLFTVTQSMNNKFWLHVNINGKKVKSKLCEMFSKGGIWGDDTDIVTLPENETWNNAVFAADNESVTQQIKGKFVSNFYYINFIIETVEMGQDFNIMMMELKGITQETDTTGRK